MTGQSRPLSLSRTLTANVRGSLLWRAPEMMLQATTSQLRATEYGTAADVYSFGVILWEIFTRCAPYAQVADAERIVDGVRSGR